MKSEFYPKFCFDAEWSPLSLVWSLIFDPHITGSLATNSFLYVVSRINSKLTILELEARLLISFLNYFDFLRMIFRIRTFKEISIWTVSVPVSTCLQLIIKIFIIFFGKFFFGERFRIRAFTSKWIILANMFVSWFYLKLSVNFLHIDLVLYVLEKELSML